MKKLLIAGLTLSLLLVGCGSKTDFNQISGQQGNVGGSPPPPPPPPPPAQNPPVAQNDAFTTDENQPLTVGAPGVLVNDTVNNAAITFPTTSAQGGTVAGNQDGSFTYTPATDFNGADTFVYTLTNSAGSDSATVTITVQAVVVQGFFVDSENGDDATGSFETGAPFATVQAAVDAAPEGADIVVRPGTYEGTISLKNGQRLLGSGSELITAQGDIRPVLSQGSIVLADNNTVDFFRIVDSVSHAINGNDSANGTVTNCEIVGTAAGAVPRNAGFRAQNATGEWTIEGNNISGTDGDCVSFRIGDTNEFSVTIADNTLTDSQLSAIGFITEDSAEVRAAILDNSMSGNNIQTGFPLEIEVLGDSTFCLALEDNTLDNNAQGDVFSFFVNPLGDGVLSVEQLSVLTDPQPPGAGNVGTVNDGTGNGGKAPEEVAEGACGN